MLGLKVNMFSFPFPSIRVMFFTFDFDYNHMKLLRKPSQTVNNCIVLQLCILSLANDYLKYYRLF